MLKKRSRAQGIVGTYKILNPLLTFLSASMKHSKGSKCPLDQKIESSCWTKYTMKLHFTFRSSIKSTSVTTPGDSMFLSLLFEFSACTLVQLDKHAESE